MTYEVKRGQVVLSHTESESCVDGPDKMTALMNAGHTLYIDGVRLARKDLASLFIRGGFSYKKFQSLKGKVKTLE